MGYSDMKSIMGKKMKGWPHVVSLQNTHTQLLPIRVCKTGGESGKRKRQIEMWRGAEALYPQGHNKCTTHTNMNMHFKI